MIGLLGDGPGVLGGAMRPIPAAHEPVPRMRQHQVIDLLGAHRTRCVPELGRRLAAFRDLQRLEAKGNIDAVRAQRGPGNGTETQREYRCVTPAFLPADRETRWA